MKAPRDMTGGLDPTSDAFTPRLAPRLTLPPSSAAAYVLTRGMGRSGGDSRRQNEGHVESNSAPADSCLLVQICCAAEGNGGEGDGDGAATESALVREVESALVREVETLAAADGFAAIVCVPARAVWLPMDIPMEARVRSTAAPRLATVDGLAEGAPTSLGVDSVPMAKAVKAVLARVVWLAVVAVAVAVARRCRTRGSTRSSSSARASTSAGMGSG